MERSKIIEKFNGFNYTNFADFFNRYKNDLLPERIEPTVIYTTAKGGIAVFAVRCNDDISFNNEVRNNDLLFVVEITDDERSIVLHQFDVTTDPCSKKNRIAHLARQIYRGNVGLHRATDGRTCIRSDFGGGTWVRRTDTNGDVIDVPNGHYDAVLGHYGVNIHDNGGFYNSSLGCIILSSLDDFKNRFKPLLKECSNKSNIPVAVINHEYFDGI